jgi:hypothetical protein
MWILAWLVVGGLVIYLANWWFTEVEGEDEEITVGLIPVVFLLMAIWPITVLIFLGEIFKRHKDGPLMEVFSRLKNIRTVQEDRERDDFNERIGS